MMNKMSKGQLAMLAARGGLEPRTCMALYSAPLLAKARTILEHTPLLVDDIIPSARFIARRCTARGSQGGWIA